MRLGRAQRVDTGSDAGSGVHAIHNIGAFMAVPREGRKNTVFCPTVVGVATPMAAAAQRTELILDLGQGSEATRGTLSA